MAADDHKRYMPLLKGKMGELSSLQHLNVAARENLTPLLEAPPRALDPDTGRPTETIKKVIERFVTYVERYWGHLDFFLVDAAEFAPAQRLKGGGHPVTALHDLLRAADTAAVPVTGPERDASHIEATRDVASAGRRGAAIRIRREQLAEPAALATLVGNLATSLELDPPHLDLIFDFGRILTSEADEIKNEAVNALGALPDPEKWRSLIVASGAFPDTVSSHIKTGNTDTLSRRDWLLWRELLDRRSELPRMPAFGDYGVAAPAWLEGFDPKKMDYAAKLVYTRPDDWLVVRGHSVKNQGNAQFRELAKKLTSDPTFQGKDHCWGDEYALARAAGGSPGVAMTWIRAATRHHLAVVDAQLSSLP